MNWSQSDLEKMDEKQWRMYMSLRLDEIHDSITEIKSGYVSKSCFWKTVASGALALLVLAIKSLCFPGNKG